jgi:hypothetical protein
MLVCLLLFITMPQLVMFFFKYRKMRTMPQLVMLFLYLDVEWLEHAYID